MKYTCPKCGKPVGVLSTAERGGKEGRGEYFPFCSERCRLTDLGAWFDAEYRIPEEVDEEENNNAGY